MTLFFFTKKFRTLDPHPLIAQDFFLKKKSIFFWTSSLMSMCSMKISFARTCIQIFAKSGQFSPKNGSAWLDFNFEILKYDQHKQPKVSTKIDGGKLFLDCKKKARKQKNIFISSQALQRLPSWATNYQIWQLVVICNSTVCQQVSDISCHLLILWV